MGRRHRAGPAAAQCALTLTARQANQLDGYLREGPEMARLLHHADHARL